MAAETMKQRNRVVIFVFLFLAGSMLANLAANNGELQDWAKVLADGEADTLDRLEAAAKLGESQNAEFIPLLSEVLKDDNKAVRWAVAKALWQFQDPTIVPPLIEYLDKEEGYTWGKILAMNALRSLKDPRAVNSLLRKLSDPNPFLRRSAALALSSIGGETAVLGIMELLKDDEAWLARIAHGLLVELNEPQLEDEVPRGYTEWMQWYETNREETAKEEER